MSQYGSSGDLCRTVSNLSVDCSCVIRSFVLLFKGSCAERIDEQSRGK